MAKRKRDLRSHCPISFALDHIGDKWSLLILRDLLFKGKNRYKEFLEAGEGISSNILADRLVQLEQLRFIEKMNDPDNGRQFVYLPTDKALDLIPVLLALVQWSSIHDRNTAAPKEFLTQMNFDKKKLEMEIRNQVMNAIEKFGFIRKQKRRSTK